MLDGVTANQKTAQQDNFSNDDLNRWVDYLRWLGVNVEEPSGEKFEDEASY